MEVGCRLDLGYIIDLQVGVISQEWLKIEVKLLLSANRKSYVPRRLAQQQMTLSDLELPFHASHSISAVAELLVLYWLQMRRKLCNVHSLLYVLLLILKHDTLQYAYIENWVLSFKVFKGTLHSELALGFFLAGLKIYIFVTCLSQIACL